jgi:hypothetical protein
MREDVLAQHCCALWLNLRVRQIPQCKFGKAFLPDRPVISR